MPVLFPTRMFPYVGEVLIPVPPKAVESVEVALSTPLIAWRVPVRVPMVAVPVAVKLAVERLPEKRPLPWTEKR